MKLLIVPNLALAGAAECTRNTVAQLRQLGITPMLSSEHAAQVGICGVETGESSGLLAKCDMMVVIGGDGTMVHETIRAMQFEKPILGINSGHLGFLTQLESNDLQPLHCLADGSYHIEQRMLLTAVIHRKNGDEICHAVNDIVLSRSHLDRLVDIDIWCGKDNVVTYTADGIIFATPTGSTAYSMSAGGPIVDPTMEAIIMTPKCPHSFFSRSLIFPAEQQLVAMPSKLRRNDHSKLYISVDGDNLAPISGEESIVIRRSERVARFVDIRQKGFYTILSEKLKFRGI